MVRSMRHWAFRSGLIEPSGSDRRGGAYRPTELGSLIFGEAGADPYMEDPGTAWLVHWQLCSDPYRSPTTWFYLFNDLREQAFTLPEAVGALWRLADEAATKKASRKTIERDVSCFLRTYTSTKPDHKISQEDTYDSPLADLRLLQREPETDRIVFDRSARPTLPPGIVAFAAVSFWDRVAPDSDTLSFEQIAYGPGSPGQVFKLSENALVDHLESIHEATSGACSFDSTAGMRQLMRRRRKDPLIVLKDHYASYGETTHAT